MDVRQSSVVAPLKRVLNPLAILPALFLLTAVVSAQEVNTAPVVEARTGCYEIEQGKKYASIFLGEDAVIEDETELDQLTYLWSVLGAPEGAQVTLNEPTQLRCSACVDMAGTYTFELAVSDGEFTTSDTVTVTINP